MVMFASGKWIRVELVNNIPLWHLFQLLQELWVTCAADQMQVVSSNDQTS